MPFPTNITREHLLKSIEKIEREGVPADGDSQYYDVIYEGNRYPPKIVVSYANIFANGTELDRNTFSGGQNTPCFKLLGDNGFEIVTKNSSMNNQRVKIYDIKSSASPNSHELLSPDGKYFFWNSDQFKGNQIGDNIFFVDRYQRWALCTEIRVLDINTDYDSQTNTSTFSHENNTYPVSGKYDAFIRFDIIKKAQIPAGWNYTKQLGQSEVYDLYKPSVVLINTEDRLQKIDDLEVIFTQGEPLEILEETRHNLQGLLLNQDIIDAVNSSEVQNDLAENEFHFAKAQVKLNKYKEFPEPSEGFFQNAYQRFTESGKTYSEYIKEIPAGSDLHRYFLVIGQLISYCDINAAGKNDLNEYPDKRTLARSFVRQTDWVNHLLHNKVIVSEVDLMAPSIRNAISYLEDPTTGITMLSEKHRAMVSKYLLRQSNYNRGTFVRDLIAFFRPYKIKPANSLNLTSILAKILYRYPKVHKLWFERISGLAVIDTTGWQEQAIKDLSTRKKLVFWWHRSPTRKVTVDKLLPQTIKEDGFFYFYFFANNEAVYRARVLEYAYEDDYQQKNWGKYGDVFDLKPDFRGYTDNTGKKAIVAFLADEIVHLATPIPADRFDFYDSEPPVRVNLQPYSELNWTDESVEDKTAERKFWFVCQGKTFTPDEGMQFLWAPLKDKNGIGKHYWENMSLVKKGDIIFNYADGVRGVSIATSDGYSADNTSTTSDWNREGQKVDINLTELNRVIKYDELRARKDDFVDALEKGQGPFDINGDVKQGYLFRFSKAAGRLVRDIYGQQFGNKEIDDFFDDVAVERLQPTKTSAMTPKDIIEHAHRYMLSKGFQYQPEEVANFYLALKTKPFVILAGISGTGKSRLPKMFAKAIGMKDEHVPLVPVRPDWTDGSELLGFTGLDNVFKPQCLTTTILEAKQNSDKPYFFILDEMNLARVEHYFSDFLSVIETREWSEENGKVTTQNILREETLPKKEEADKNKGLKWPDNLYLIGTVNMDETTHAFSRKVLDRANSIEMNEIDLSWPKEASELKSLEGVNNSLFATEYLLASDLTEADKNAVEAEMNLLKAANKIMQEADLHFAYRVRDEVAFYLCLNKKYGLMRYDTAFDFQMMQKVLPRIHGSSERIQTVLVKLLNLLEGTKYNSATFDVNKAKDDLNKTELKYKRATRKILFMLKRFDEDRFTSFWL